MVFYYPNCISISQHISMKFSENTGNMLKFIPSYFYYVAISSFYFITKFYELPECPTYFYCIVSEIGLVRNLAIRPVKLESESACFDKHVYQSIKFSYHDISGLSTLFQLISFGIVLHSHVQPYLTPSTKIFFISINCSLW